MRFSTLRVLITGGTGLLGVNWAAAMRDEHEIWLGTHRNRIALRGVRAIPLEFGSVDALERSVGDLRPALLVHAAGYSSVDECERTPTAARELNANAAAIVAEFTARHALKLVHISTDHLFAGDRPFYGEYDPPSPINVYAQTKLEGERLVAERCPQALIVRTNFFGWGHALRRSLSDWVIEGLRARQPLYMFTDVFFTPILATRLARAAHELLAAGASGVLHVTGDERVSKHEFALRLAAAFGLPADQVRSVLYEQARLAAPRARDMSLSNAKAHAVLGRVLGGLDEFLRDLRLQEEAGLSRELRSAVTR